MILKNPITPNPIKDNQLPKQLPEHLHATKNSKYFRLPAPPFPTKNSSRFTCYPAYSVQTDARTMS